MQELKVNVKGMMCAGCENRVKNALKEIEDVDDVFANHISGEVVVKGNNISKSIIEEIIQDLGYEIVKED